MVSTQFEIQQPVADAGGWRVLAPFKVREYRLLIAAVSLSIFAEGMWAVVMALQVIELDNDPASLSLVATCLGAGLVAFVLVGGLAADRISQRAIIIAVETVNVIRLDDYVRGVVAAESPSSWAPEALKAQAVAARTYALTSDAGGGTFELYADTRSQMYGGVGAETFLVSQQPHVRRHRLQAARREAEDAGAAQEIGGGQPAGKAGGAAGRQYMRRAGDVIAQDCRRVRTEKDRSGSE